MAKRKTKTVLTDDQKFSRMENWAKKLGFPADTAKKLCEKYGMYAYDLMLKAMMSPGSLKIKDGKAASAYTKPTIHYMLGEDVNGNPVAENFVSTKDIAKIVGKDVATVEAEINEFREAHDIPTALPTPPQDIKQAEQAQQRVEQHVDAQQSVGHQADQIQSASPEADANEAAWIEQELARMKGGKTGELSFDTLRKNGLSDDDMQNAMTSDMVKEVHAGSTSQMLAKNARKCKRRMSGSGNCLAGVQYAMCDTIPGFCYADVAPPKLPGCTSNSACFSNQAWEKSGKFTVFKFKNDKENGNDCLRNPPPCAGAIVNFDRGQTKHGHVTVSNGQDGYDCDIHQTANSIASGVRADGTPYGDNFYISFSNDCTVSDDLARQMLHERYLREHPNMQENAQSMTPTKRGEHFTSEQRDSVTTVTAEWLYQYWEHSQSK